MWSSIVSVIDKLLALLLLKRQREASADAIAATAANEQRVLQEKIDAVTAELKQVNAALLKCPHSEIEDLQRRKTELLLRLNQYLNK